MASIDLPAHDINAHKHILLPSADQTTPRQSQNGVPVPARAPANKEQNSQRYTQPTSDRKKRRKPNEGAMATACRWIVEHQTGLTMSILLLHGLINISLPRLRQHTEKFYRLSYFNLSTGKYAAGWDDLYLVLYSIVLLSFLRVTTMDYILTPLASLCGIQKSKDKTRFAEQAWVLVYYGLLVPLGTYILYTHEHWLNYKELWTGWPSREIEGSMKWYYLIQFSFWLQQIMVVNIEERRKDHWQMFTHHCITCALMFWSYGYHQTKVGNLILVLMDVVDIFFAFAKILKYMQYQLACDVAFGAFMVVWFVARHVFYAQVIYSVYKDLPEQTKYGCYSGGAEDLHGPTPTPNDWSHLLRPFLDPKGLVCWNDGVKWGFIYTLLALQAIFYLWFGMIVRVAIKVLKGNGADDTRSDDEDDEDEETIENLNVCYQPSLQPPPYEEEVGVEGIKLHKPRSSPVRTFRKRGGGVSSGVTLPSDRKELLGRIGCDGGHD